MVCTCINLIKKKVKKNFNAISLLTKYSPHPVALIENVNHDWQSLKYAFCMIIDFINSWGFATIFLRIIVAFHILLFSSENVFEHFHSFLAG